MKIFEIEISELKPYEKNAKKHPKEQIDGLARMIEKVGVIQPVVIGKNNTIIIGHGRAEAAKQAGLTKIPVVKLNDLTEAEERALRLFDNRIAETTWDFDNLRLELFELKAIDFDMSLTAFSELELQQYFPGEGSKQNVEFESKVNSKYILFVECHTESELKKLYDEFKNRNLNVSLA